MCHAVPARIVAFTGPHTARIEMEGLHKEVSVELVPEAELGDYVVVHVGYALSRLDEQEALETLRLLDKVRNDIPG